MAGILLVGAETILRSVKVLKDEATLVVTEARFYKAAVGTEPPGDLTKMDAATAWTEIGHTSPSDPLSITTEGGDVEVLASLQNKKLRTLTKDITQSLELTLYQFDKETLKFFLGENAVVNGKFMYRANNIQPVSCALLCVVQDGTNVFGVHAYKTEASANGDFSAEDSENLTGLPVKFTALGHNDKPATFGMTPLEVTTPAKPVTPGSGT